MANTNAVPKLYQSVVDDVISNVREFFLDDGVDEQVLLELKQLWQSKLLSSKVLQPHEPPPAPVPIPAQPVQQQPHLVTHQQAHVQPAPAIQAHVPVANHVQSGLLEQMSGPAQTATLALPPGLYQQQLAALQGTITLTQGGQQFIIQAAPNQLVPARQPAPTTTAAQGVVYGATAQPTTTDQQAIHRMVQLDGGNDSSSDDDDDDEDDAEDKDDEDDDQNDEDGDEEGQEEEPLNSADDVSSEEDPTEVFDTESVVVCQFDKINRNKNKWKFHLKDGIMNLNGKDYVFQKGVGEAEW